MFTKIIIGKDMSRECMLKHSSYVAGYLEIMDIPLANAKYFDTVFSSTGSELYGDSMLGISSYYNGTQGLGGISPLALIEIPS